MNRPIRRLLVANRGEIALRVIRAARELGISTVAVCSALDRDGLWCRAADTVVELGGESPASSYLNTALILGAAHRSGADSVHPGYGFFSENAGFAQAATDAGLNFVGPSPEVIGWMGDKLAARRIAADAGVPILPGAEDPGPEALRRLGLPVLLKAAGGGGGRGMREVQRAEQLDEALAEARAEAEAAFGDARIYVERRLVGARHIEVQVLADRHGGLLHLGERECSIQRRHQKLVEECPSPVLDARQRAAIGAAALRLLERTGYLGVGTVEFLLDASGEFYFLEMNTRIQVEHPVTEAVWGVDLVAEQLRLASGSRLSVTDATPRGHAIECRIIAEDPANHFLPSPGRISRLRLPSGPGIRIDSGVEEGSVIPELYDPLLLKLSAWGPDRESARRRMVEALRDTVLLGPATTAEFLRDLLESPEFIAGATPTTMLPPFLAAWRPEPHLPAMVIGWMLQNEAGFSSATARGGGAPARTGAGQNPWTTAGAWRMGS